MFKNHGNSAGTSILHSHSQVISLSKVPKLIIEKSNKGIRNGRCRYCDIIKSEVRTKRKIESLKTAVAFAPYASRYNYEAWVFPKRHIKRLDEFSEQEYMDTAQLIKKIALKLKNIGVAFNMFLHYAPKGKNMHLHIEVCPRKAIHAGFEISTGFIVNAVSPESAAEFYRG